MSAKVVKGSAELGNKIRLRRNELGFTIEEAASKAGGGTKTWARYEAGESIRHDKVKGLCKILDWRALPEQESGEPELDIDDYKRREIWPQEFADAFGDATAISFVIGSDILLDNIEQDLENLSCKPKGTHIGELEFSWLQGILPLQFIMQYDYDFLYYLKTILMCYRGKAANGLELIAHTVVEELVLYLIMEESKPLMEECIIPHLQSADEDAYLDWDVWPFDLFDDMDIVTFLYCDGYLEEEHPYHFKHWREQQFYCERE